MAVLDSMSTGSAPHPHHSVSKEERKVIFASSLGTVLERTKGTDLFSDPPPEKVST
ncbi:hypothetical protein [Pseudomonas sp. MWU12-2029]|uniref:hypothetical protein n=1 Tax=Pseudomonas sp. MWU12-2029 TaxID=2927805 RepID=UPI00200DD3A2|nr:hypothetical protein [Pseudomonas sp. MWU12-2029]